MSVLGCVLHGMCGGALLDILSLLMVYCCESINASTLKSISYESALKSSYCTTHARPDCNQKPGTSCLLRGCMEAGLNGTRLMGKWKETVKRCSLNLYIQPGVVSVTCRLQGTNKGEHSLNTLPQTYILLLHIVILHNTYCCCCCFCCMHCGFVWWD